MTFNRAYRFVVLLVLWPLRCKKLPPLDAYEMRRVRRLCDRMHAEERLPHE